MKRKSKITVPEEPRKGFADYAFTPKTGEIAVVLFDHVKKTPESDRIIEEDQILPLLEKLTELYTCPTGPTGTNQ